MQREGTKRPDARTSWCQKTATQRQSCWGTDGMNGPGRSHTGASEITQTAIVLVFHVTIKTAWQRINELTWFFVGLIHSALPVPLAIIFLQFFLKENKAHLISIWTTTYLPPLNTKQKLISWLDLHTYQKVNIKLVALKFKVYQHVTQLLMVALLFSPVFFSYQKREFSWPCHRTCFHSSFKYTNTGLSHIKLAQPDLSYFWSV